VSNRLVTKGLLVSCLAIGAGLASELSAQDPSSRGPSGLALELATGVLLTDAQVGSGGAALVLDTIHFAADSATPAFRDQVAALAASHGARLGNSRDLIQGSERWSRWGTGDEDG
jgi:hypothetical protein